MSLPSSRFHCQHCNKSYASKQSLSNHLSKCRTLGGATTAIITTTKCQSIEDQMKERIMGLEHENAMLRQQLDMYKTVSEILDICSLTSANDIEQQREYLNTNYVTAGPTLWQFVESMQPNEVDMEQLLQGESFFDVTNRIWKRHYECLRIEERPLYCICPNDQNGPLCFIRIMDMNTNKMQWVLERTDAFIHTIHRSYAERSQQLLPILHSVMAIERACCVIHEVCEARKEFQSPEMQPVLDAMQHRTCNNDYYSQAHVNKWRQYKMELWRKACILDNVLRMKEKQG